MSGLRLEPSVPAALLVLIGGGEFSFGETREIDEFLIAKILPDRKTIAFLPTASGSAEYAGHFGHYIQTIDPSVETVNVPVYRGRDARRQKNLNAILSAGLIYLGGGVTNSLLATIRESPADLALREAAANGAVVVAMGAAAACFGLHARDMRGGTASLPALGWIGSAVIETGFEPAADEMLRRLMSIQDVTVGLGIPARTALAVRRDGSTMVVGGGQITTFRKG